MPEVFLVSMQVTVRYFGVLRDHTGSECETIHMPEGCSLATLLKVLEQRRPAAESRLWAASAVALNLQYLRDTGSFDAERLSEGDEIAFLPPVSGGTDAR